MKYFLFGFLSSFSLLVSAGIRTVGNGGGFVEIVVLSEYKDFMFNLKQMEKTENLSSDAILALRKWQKLSPKLYFVDNDLGSPLVQCSDQGIFFNHNKLIDQSVESADWPFDSRRLLVQGYSCLTHESPLTLTEILSRMQNDRSSSTLFSRLKDIYKPDLGLYGNWQQGRLKLLIFLTDQGDLDFTEKFSNLLQCSDGRSYSLSNLIIEEPFFSVNENKLWWVGTINASFACSQKTEIRSFEIRIELKTNLSDMRRIFESKTEFLLFPISGTFIRR